MKFPYTALLVLLALPAQSPAKDEFADSIRPVLAQNCAACHNPNGKNRVNFLKANTAPDIESNRGLWRNVAAQLRNRTMPPIETKLTEDQRLHVAAWIDDRLRQTACNVGDFAGAVALRRLNRREYRNTIRDLLGVDYNVSELFPSDGTGGSGFDTNGETLFIPPLLVERYLEAAQQILDRAIVTPDLAKNFTAAELLPLQSPAQSGAAPRELPPGKELTAMVSDLRRWRVRRAGRHRTPRRHGLALAQGGRRRVRAPEDPAAAGPRRRTRCGAPSHRRPARPPGARTARAHAGERYRASAGRRRERNPARFPAIAREARAALPPPRHGARQRAAQARKAAEQMLRSFLPKAYRRPVEAAEVTPLMTLYDRAAQRGDPYEERMKLALKAVLVSPDFLFRWSIAARSRASIRIGQYELASRLSYFLWSTMPDDELYTLAGAGQAAGPQSARRAGRPHARRPALARLRQHVHRTVAGHAGSRRPRGALLTELQHFYTPEVAADLREEPILFFERILGENRSMLELLDRRLHVPHGTAGEVLPVGRPV